MRASPSRCAVPRRACAGFTVVELITVIVILGILSAVALPRFSNLETEARSATLDGLRGALLSAASLARAQWLAEGSSGSSVDMDGVPVTVDGDGWPTEDLNGIGTAIQNPGGDFQFDGAGTYELRPSCSVQYNLLSPAPPEIIKVETGC